MLTEKRSLSVTALRLDCWGVRLVWSTDRALQRANKPNQIAKIVFIIDDNDGCDANVNIFGSRNDVS